MIYLFDILINQSNFILIIKGYFILKVYYFQLNFNEDFNLLFITFFPILILRNSFF